MENIFQFNEIKEDYTSLLKKLNENTFSNSYPFYNYIGNYFSYKIFKKDLTGSPAIIFRKKIKVNIKLKDSNGQDKKETFFAHSNIDIKNKCKEKLIDINSLLLNDGEAYKNDDFQFYFSYIKNDELELSMKSNEKLPKISHKDLFVPGVNHKVKDYSTYYKDYFEDKDLNPDDEFEYKSNEVREEIFNNIFLLQGSSELETFKFTGPFNIGKTITLLELCRTTHNAFYLNLKYLTINSFRDCYIMLQEEFSRIVPEIFAEIQEIINYRYSIYTKPLDLIFIIMDVLFKEKKQYNFVFVFDQYKEDIFSYNKDNLKKYKGNIKIVYCSSINDNKIRGECLTTWKECKSNPKKLNTKNQKYYFYYIDIYTPSGLKSYSIMENITSIKRFKKLITNESSNEEKILKIKGHITEKMTKFSSQVEMSFDHMITYLKTIINKKYDNEKLDNIMKFCPLKYLVVRFIENSYFKIQLQFPLIRQIINRELFENEIDNYFKNRKYLSKLITNKTIKGDYFEEAAKKGLSFILPSKCDYILEVKEIITMEKIVGNSLDYDYLSDDLEENEEDENDISEESYSREDEENFIEMDIESLSDNNSNNKSLNLKGLLKKFSINNFDDINKKNSKILNDLESYRRNEIVKLKRKDNTYMITQDYNGNETFFISQKSKKGRVIDCAYLDGKRDNKTFIAFQMKWYFDETETLKKKARDKQIIKKNLQKILINSMYLLNCKICHWYYYLIFYYNPILPKCNVNQKIINDYKGNIEILFYDPLEKVFYDCELNKITKLQKTEKANLDIIKISLDYYRLKAKISFTETTKNYQETAKSFIEDFKFMKKNDELSIIKEIASIMNISQCFVYLDGKVEVNKYILSYPDYNTFFLYKRRNIGFLGMKSFMDYELNTIILFYDLYEEKEINTDEFFQLFDPKFNYVYILKTGRRTFNELPKEPSEFNFPMEKKGKFKK